MVFTIFLITASLLLQSGSALWCFHCNDTIKCPTICNDTIEWRHGTHRDSTNKEWKHHSDHCISFGLNLTHCTNRKPEGPGFNHTHYNISTTWDESEGFACIIGSIGESIVYQNITSMSECTSNFREVEFNKSNQRVSYECCNKNGCNWNRETAQQNFNYSHIWKQHAVSQGKNPKCLCSVMPMTHWIIIGVCMTAIMTFVFTIPVGEEMEAEARNSLAFADFLVRPSDRGY